MFYRERTTSFYPLSFCSWPKNENDIRDEQERSIHTDLKYLGVHGSFQKENEDLKKPFPKASSSCHIKNNTLRRYHKTVGLGLEGGNSGVETRKYMGETKRSEGFT